MHQWLQDAGVKGGEVKGNKMVQAGREVLFKIKNAYFQEVLQGQQQSVVRSQKGGGRFVPNNWTKVGQDRSVPARALPVSKHAAVRSTAKKAQSRKYISNPSGQAGSSTLNQTLNLPPKARKPEEATPDFFGDCRNLLLRSV